jgi:outer membrane murein-binding lipoprotein Lpp
VKPLSAKIDQLEVDSLRAAAKVNELTKQHGADHESVKAARAELNKALNDALDARFLREEFRVKELRTRLGQLEQQIGQRKAQRATIIERRAEELLNGGAFKWNTSALQTGTTISDRSTIN